MKTSSFFHRYREIILGLLMLGLSTFYLYHATLIRVRSSVKVSAKLIPEILGGIVLVLAVLQLVSGIKYLLKTRAENKANNVGTAFMTAEEKGSFTPVILTFVIIVGYAVVFETLGFVVSSTICMFLQMWLMTPKSKSNPLKFLLISVVSAFVIYVAFRKGLDLSLPPGILEFLPI